MEFDLEHQLVDKFLDSVQSHDFGWGQNIGYITEFDYSRGRTDIVLVSISYKVIAIEAKLMNWRYALHQAYRNTCFAQFSYVLLPEEVIPRAIKFEREFRRRSVGLCYLSKKKLRIALVSHGSEPLQPWLNSLATEKVLLGNNGFPN